VIAVISVLLSLLQPALAQMMFKASIVECQKNLKSILAGTLLYSDDNYDFYPENPIQGSRRYSYTLGGTDSSNNEKDNDGLIPILEPYFGGSLNNTFMCSGVKEHSYWKTPQANGIYNNDFDNFRRVWGGDVPSSYQLYFNTHQLSTGGKMMRKVGEYLHYTAYRAGSAVVKTNIVASDMSHEGTNHVAPGFSKTERTLNNNGALFYSSLWNNNYVFDDGSVLTYEHLVIPGETAYNTAKYQHYLKKVFAITIYEYCNIPRGYLVD
jgi:hypothetical protein